MADYDANGIPPLSPSSPNPVTPEAWLPSDIADIYHIGQCLMAAIAGVC